MDKSLAFAVRSVRACQHLRQAKREYTLSEQFLRSATSIGANIHEANNAYGKKDFIAKMYIAYKEASETEYWIKLMTETEYFTRSEGDSLLGDCAELKQILTAILKNRKISEINSAFCIPAFCIFSRWCLLWKT